MLVSFPRYPTVEQRVLPVIDLASKQADSLGWQLREMNHLILPHIKNAVLEAALAATQVRLVAKLLPFGCVHVDVDRVLFFQSVWIVLQQNMRVVNHR